MGTCMTDTFLIKTLCIFLVIAAVTIFVLILIRQRSYYNESLPHNNELNSISASEAIYKLRQSPTDEVFFSISDGF